MAPTLNGSGFPVALSQSKPKARAAQQPEDADQAIVYTPYGRGLVLRTRKSDGIKEVQLLEWESFAKPARGSKPQKPYMMYTAVDYPSVVPHVGDDVVCQYGRGRVTQISRVAATTNDTKKGSDPMLKYTIALSSWRLNGRSTVTVHVTNPPPRVVRKHTLSEMDAHEKVSLAQSQKSKATSYFSQKKDYELALTTYAGAVDAVRNVQHDHTSTNEVRADLVVVMVTCSNNAATCCAKLGKWEEASKFAKNALILLDALYGKRGKKIHTILTKEGTINAKLFGEWRVKSYLIVARSCMEAGGDVAAATGILKKARGVAMEYIDEINAKQQKQPTTTCSKEEKASLRSLTSQVKEIRKLLVECSDLKKATKKLEQRRAKAMFGDKKNDNKENASPSDANKKQKEGGQQQQQQTKKKEQEKKSATGSESSVYKKLNGTDTSANTTSGTQRSLDDTKETSTSRKLVSFSEHPPEVKEFERSSSSDDDDDDSPWYSEHKEALIMLAVAGFSAVALMAMRRSFR